MAIGWHQSKKYKEYDSLKKLKSTLEKELKKDTGNATLKYKIRGLKKQVNAISPLVNDKFDGVASITGWLITALALMLGAPFWFDLLTKFMSIRAAGVKPPSPPPPTPAPDAPSPIIPAAAASAGGSVDSQYAATDGSQPEIVPDEATDNSIAQG